MRLITAAPGLKSNGTIPTIPRTDAQKKAFPLAGLSHPAVFSRFMVFVTHDKGERSRITIEMYTYIH
jgi:hypothetical protein